MKFTFGDMVVVEGIYIGVVIKCWENFFIGKKNYKYDVYVRSFNEIKNYEESEIERYMVRHKELNAEELYYQQQALGKGE